MLKIILTLLFILLSSSPLIAQPSITSVSQDSASILTITGYLFGSKPISHPLVFDNFDKNDSARSNGSQIPGKNCSHYGSWRNESYNYTPIYTNSGNRLGSTLCSYHYMVGVSGQNHAPLWNDFAQSNTPTVLVDFWTKFTYTTTSSFQFKYWRLTNALGDQDGNANFQDLWWNGRESGKKGYYEFFLSGGVNPKWPNYSIQQGYDDVTLDYNKGEDGAWHHYTVFIKQGSSGVADGKLTIFVDGTRIAHETAMITWINGTEVKSLTLGWYLGNNSDGSSTYGALYFDDIYVDYTWQSVWIGNASDWNSCTHREIQIPTAWSDNSITITGNQGSFATGSTVYLYVVDDKGNTNSQGYPVTIQKAVAPPSAPKGLRITN